MKVADITKKYTSEGQAIYSIVKVREVTIAELDCNGEFTEVKNAIKKQRKFLRETAKVDQSVLSLRFKG